MKTIAILGCGWLGFPLAQSLISKGYEVKGSTTSENKLELLKSNKIEPFLLELSETKISDSITEFLYDSDILIIDIPPGLRKVISTSNEMTFVNKIEKLIPYIEKSGIQKVLFVSSTSVYGDSFPIVEITEETKPNPDTESGKQLVIAETLLQSNPHFKTTVIRFGGLLGEDRHPIKFLAGRTNIENPNAPVNMIQREDCIGVIEKAIEFARDDNQTFNAVAPQHPTRKAYYQKKAELFHLPLPNIWNQKVKLFLVKKRKLF